MDALTNCPICLSSNAKVVGIDWSYRVDCTICGGFILERKAWDDFLNPQTGVGHNLRPFHRARISHKIRTAKEFGAGKLPQITSEFVDRFIKDGCPGPTPKRQALNAIRFIGDEISRTGEVIASLPGEFFAIIGSSNPNMCGKLLFELRNKDLIEGIDVQSTTSPPTLLNVNMTLAGWEEYENERAGKVSGKYGFIALKFNDPVLDPLTRDVIKPTLKELLGFDLLDMRDVARAGIIDNIMRAQIRDAAFVIVDLTHDNAGAYWEAGYAEGLGKPVVYICERTKFDEAMTHFDTNHCTTVVWSTTETDHFKSELVATLRRSLNIF